MNKHYQSIHRYDFLTKSLLEQEYLINGLTDSQIAQKYNMPSKTVVWRKRKKFKIDNKYPSKSNKHARKNRKFELTYGDAVSLLDNGLRYQDIADKLKCSVVVVKRRLTELGLTQKLEEAQKYHALNILLDHGQKQLLIGSLLGDGRVTVHNAYTCTHSIKQKGYLIYKMKKLSNIWTGKIHDAEHLDPQGKLQKAVLSTTGCNRYIAELRKLFYLPDGKKIVPVDFLYENLEAEGLAYWYMDDGSYHKKNKLARLHTEGFLKSDIDKLIHFFKKKFNLTVKAYKSGLNKLNIQMYCLAMPVHETANFIALIKDYVIPMFHYKIGKYDT